MRHPTRQTRLHIAAPARLAGDVPLVVDLDGTLIRGDLLHASALKMACRQPLAALQAPFWLLRGKAALKDGIAGRVAIDATTLPYRQDLIDWLHEQKAAGRRLVLCTATSERYAAAVAAHLGLFDQVIASGARTNVSSHRKAEILVRQFGDKGFDYAGNSGADLHVWERARKAIVVNAPPRVARAARRRFELGGEFPAPPATLRTWLRALRQWGQTLSKAWRPWMR